MNHVEKPSELVVSFEDHTWAAKCTPSTLVLSLILPLTPKSNGYLWSFDLEMLSPFLSLVIKQSL